MTLFVNAKDVLAVVIVVMCMVYAMYQVMR